MSQTLNETVRDCRSVCIAIEPMHAPGKVTWRGLAFVGGHIIRSVAHDDRAVVLDELAAAVAADTRGRLERDVDEATSSTVSVNSPFGI